MARNFQRRGELRSLLSHGKNRESDGEAIEDRLPTIRSFLQNFEKKDIFNADEFGHFHCMAFDRTIGPDLVLGPKKEKLQLAYLAYTKSSGSEKIPIMCLGTGARTRCF